MIYNRIKELRTKHGGTQEELAEAVGVSRQTVVAIEKNNYEPSLLLGLKLAKYFKVKIEELFELK